MDFIPGKFYSVKEIDEGLTDLRVIHKIKGVDYHLFRNKSHDDGNRYYLMYVSKAYWLKEIRERGLLKI